MKVRILVIYLLLALRDAQSGSSLTKSLRTQPNFRAVYLSEPLSIVAKLPFVFSAPIKVIHQICTVLVALMIRVGRPPQFILVQVSERVHAR